jgi:hypothetical protein
MNIYLSIYLKQDEMFKFIIENTYKNISYKKVVFNNLNLDYIIEDVNIVVTTTFLNIFSFAMIITKLSNFSIKNFLNDFIFCNSTKIVDFFLFCNSTTIIDFYLFDESTKTIDFLFYQSTKTIDVFLFY